MLGRSTYRISLERHLTQATQDSHRAWSIYLLNENAYCLLCSFEIVMLLLYKKKKCLSTSLAPGDLQKWIDRAELVSKQAFGCGHTLSSLLSLQRSWKKWHRAPSAALCSSRRTREGSPTGSQPWSTCPLPAPSWPLQRSAPRARMRMLSTWCWDEGWGLGTQYRWLLIPDLSLGLIFCIAQSMSESVLFHQCRKSLVSKLRREKKKAVKAMLSLIEYLLFTRGAHWISQPLCDIETCQSHFTDEETEAQSDCYLLKVKQL